MLIGKSRELRCPAPRNRVAELDFELREVSVYGPISAVIGPRNTAEQSLDRALCGNPIEIARGRSVGCCCVPVSLSSLPIAMGGLGHVGRELAHGSFVVSGAPVAKPRAAGRISLEYLMKQTFERRRSERPLPALSDCARRSSTGLGSRLIDCQSQKRTVAARATADRKVLAHLS